MNGSDHHVQQLHMEIELLNLENKGWQLQDVSLLNNMKISMGHGTIPFKMGNGYFFLQGKMVTSTVKFISTSVSEFSGFVDNLHQKWYEQVGTRHWSNLYKLSQLDNVQELKWFYNWMRQWQCRVQSPLRKWSSNNLGQQVDKVLPSTKITQ